MKVEVSETHILVQPEGEKFYSESLLWYRIKESLKAQGLDVIKKLMWKDGHLVDDHEYYIRERKWSWYIRDDYYSIRSLVEPFNAGKTLHLERKMF